MYIGSGEGNIVPFPTLGETVDVDLRLLFTSVTRTVAFRCNPEMQHANAENNGQLSFGRSITVRVISERLHVYNIDPRSRR